ncbi:MAG: translocation/assembly module TamB domain-containing protein, partial [Holophagales bacterium]|nr:translocation/assembly module TamB domain-containing protein [Holophagales bacterium]
MLGGPADGWLRSWRVAELDAAASLVGGALAVEESTARLQLARRSVGADPAVLGQLPSTLDLAVAARVRGPLAGPFTVDTLRARGPGLELDASATVDPESGQPIRIAFELDAELARLLPEVAAGAGALQASGNLELRSLVGRIRVRAERLPAEVLEPALGSTTLDRLGARGTLLELDADVDLPGIGEAGGGEATPAPVPAVSAELHWRRDQEMLLRAEVSTAASSRSSLELEVRASLLPELEGRRSAAGRLLVPLGGAGADAGPTIGDGARVVVQAPELDTLLAQLSDRWPLVGDALGTLPSSTGAAGPLRLEAGLRGPVVDPRIDAELDWRPGPGSRLSAMVAGRPAAPDGPELDGEVSLPGLELAELRGWLALAGAPPMEGRIVGRVGFRSRAGRYTVEPELGGEFLEPAAPGSDEMGTPESPRAGTAAGSEDSVESEALAWAAGPWRLRARLELDAGDPLAVEADAIPRLHLFLAGEEVRLGEGAVRSVSAAELTAELRGRRLDLRSLDAQLGLGDGRHLPLKLRGRAELGVVRDAGAGTLRLDPSALPRAWTVEARAERPAEGLASAAMAISVDQGRLRLDLLELEPSGAEPVPGTFSAVLPIASLEALPTVGPAVASMPWPEKAAGPLEIAFDAPSIDTDRLRGSLDLPAEARFRGSLSGALRFDPAEPSRASGRIDIPRLHLDLPSGNGEPWALRASAPLRLVLGDRQLRLDRAPFALLDSHLDLEGRAELAAGWGLTDPPAALFSHLELEGAGGLPLEVIRPHLGGAVVAGILDVDAAISGPPGALVGSVRLSGPDASISLAQPYATRIREPRARLRLTGEELWIEELEARWNEGTVSLEGKVDLGGVGGVGGGAGVDDGEVALGPVALRAFFDSVRYRLDYGLTILVSGNAEYTQEPGLSPELGGNLLVERGFLRRDIDTTREILGRLLVPPTLDVPTASPMADTRLAIDIATVDGIRVKNNVADLHSTWGTLEVRGTLGAPRVRGSIETTPGGQVFAYGQVLRLDRAVLELTGDPTVPSQLELETTSSIEDPSIATPGDQALAAALANGSLGANRQELGEEERRAEAQRQIASGLTTYYGNQLASRLGRSLSGTRLSYQPLWIYGEADPGARLVVSRELSRFVALSVALDLTDSQAQIYLLELRDFPYLSSLSGTVFTDDESRYGLMLQQELQLGDPAPEDGWPTLGKVRVSCPGCDEGQGLSERRIRGFVSYEAGDSLPDGADFDTEVDVEEALARRGWPEARVEVWIEPDQGQGDRADLVLEVIPGPELELELVGEKPPRRSRAGIRSLYRGNGTYPGYGPDPGNGPEETSL